MSTSRERTGLQSPELPDWNRPSADDLVRAGIVSASAINAASASRVAAGSAADQTDQELWRATIKKGAIKGLELFRVTAILLTPGMAGAVNKFFNFGIGPIGVTYAGSSKLAAGNGYTQLTALATVGQIRATNSVLHFFCDGSEAAQLYVNANTPVNVVGPSTENSVLIPLAIDMSEGFDLVCGCRFDAAAPAGDIIRLKKAVLEVLQ